ncbi:hypothetical protein [Paraburkholderia sp.]|uniref:hypothetical protein n=1 Tax=Paraburkholderia sp. TaxID=1926495 RepID=UPI0023983BD1|nr:hypothetical protein [Paraburkholderia sp.]MDE1179773.1 hypothetical protein [Paraburkholderia sp.]
MESHSEIQYRPYQIKTPPTAPYHKRGARRAKKHQAKPFGNQQKKQIRESKTMVLRDQAQQRYDLPAAIHATPRTRHAHARRIR